MAPVDAPTQSPTQPPTLTPTHSPTSAPTHPTEHPTLSPTNAPTTPTSHPTSAPSLPPTFSPSFSPTRAPTNTPTYQPTCRTIDYGWRCFQGEIAGFPNGICNQYDGNGKFTLGSRHHHFPYNLNYNGGNLIIRGQDPLLTTLRYVGSESTWIQCQSNGCYISLQDLTIASDRTSPNDIQLYMPSNGTLYFRNVVFDGNNYVENQNGSFWIFNGSDVHVIFEDCHFANNNFKYEMLNGAIIDFIRCTFDGNHFNNGTDIVLTASPTSAPSRQVGLSSFQYILSSNEVHVRDDGCDYGSCNYPSTNYTESCNNSNIELGDQTRNVCCQDRTRFPTYPTYNPTLKPSKSPTIPTHPPSKAPSNTPSLSPSAAPTFAPVDAPTQSHSQTTNIPSDAPTVQPSSAPSDAPTFAPVDAPTQAPTQPPTLVPTASPTSAPTHQTDDPFDIMNLA